MNEMNFNEAFKEMKCGKKITRSFYRNEYLFSKASNSNYHDVWIHKAGGQEIKLEYEYINHYFINYLPDDFQVLTPNITFGQLVTGSRFKVKTSSLNESYRKIIVPTGAMALNENTNIAYHFELALAVEEIK
jgi:hypothetical protein